MQADKLFEDALVAQQNGDHDRALDLFAQVLMLKPDHAAAWMFRGLLEDRIGRPFNALVHLEHALELQPRQDVWCNYGVICGKLGRYDAAHAAFSKALEFGNVFEVRQNLGDLYIRLMRLDDAEREFREAVRLQPNNPVAHGNLARILIAQGKWQEGHKENQHRHRGLYPPRPRQLYPVWTGQDLSNHVILLYPEGGYGDEVLGLRYALAVRDKFPNASVVLESRAPLFRLAKRLTGITVIAQDETPPAKPDYCCGLSDVPLWLGITPKTVPYPQGYLNWPQIAPRWRRPSVGLCWLSGKRPLQGWTDRLMKAKSIALPLLAPLFEHRDVEFVSLQLDRADPNLIEQYKITPMPDVHDFADTATIINSVDLVISVDTAVAHLAGAMGAPVWNLIRFDEIVTYPPGAEFYRSMKFYRQAAPNDWSGAIQTLTDDFAEFVKVHRAAAA